MKHTRDSKYFRRVRRENKRTQEFSDVYFYHIGLDYKEFTKSKKRVHVCVFLVYNFLLILKWLLQAIIRLPRVLIRFLFRDFIKAIQLAMIGLANFMIYTWIKIIVLQNVKYQGEQLDPHSNSYLWMLYDKEENQAADFLSIYCQISQLIRRYSLLASLCGVLTFWRIFQFFQFSIRLSTFISVLRIAAPDIIYFFILFSLLMFSFTVFATSIFGENIQAFSNLPSSALQLVKMLMEYDYSIFYEVMSGGMMLYFIVFHMVFRIFGIL